MRLILEIENDDDWDKLRALMTGLSFSSVEVQSTQEKLRNFVNWCQENQVLVKELTIPTREERNAR
jgi:hypothetical protein